MWSDPTIAIVGMVLIVEMQKNMAIPMMVNRCCWKGALQLADCVRLIITKVFLGKQCLEKNCVDYALTTHILIIGVKVAKPGVIGIVLVKLQFLTTGMN